jgi:hypothetical protein
MYSVNYEYSKENEEKIERLNDVIVGLIENESEIYSFLEEH